MEASSPTHPSPPRSYAAGRSRSAIVFSSELARHLEHHPSLRLPSTYVGVRRVRPERCSKSKDDAPFGKKRKRSDGGYDSGDDSWVPNAIGEGSQPEDENGANLSVDTSPDGKESAPTGIDPREVVYKVTNPDGTQRRMTKQEKRQLKYQVKQAQHRARKEERKIQHEEKIAEEKRGKRERKRIKREKWKERKRKKENCNGDSAEEDAGAQKDRGREQSADGSGDRTEASKEDGKEQTESGGVDNMPPQPSASAPNETLDDDLQSLQGAKRGIPPVMLTPAATCIAQDAGVFDGPARESITTTLDRELSTTWAVELQQSLVPVEEARAKEEMRPMAYRVVPEVWRRFCPESLWPPKEKGAERNAENMHGVDEAKAAQFQNDHSLLLVRNPSPSYDDDAYAVVKHLHRHSKFHIACGAAFGCDFLLYDGKREDRHSFAGLRVYSCSKCNGECSLPIPTAYDMAGYVRTMNTARKMALVATVARDGNAARVAIVDLALEKVLEAPTHVRKGNTEKRRSEEEAASGLSKK
ncbi:hypothetical protein ACHAXT_013012 [Thalassiosira profunda]